MSQPVFPLVSVLVICRNEERFIRHCLESVLSWECPGYEFEILVVDGRSNDRTREIVSEFEKRDVRVRLLDNPRGVKPIALNIGIRAARGEWIIRLDAHSIYPKDYAQRCLETARRTGAENVGGLFVAQLREDTVQSRLVQALTTHRFGVGNAGFRINAPEGPADTVPYGCYRREVFDKIGFFDERLTHSQDFEFNQRLRRAGGTVWLNPAIQVLYYNQATLKDFFVKVLKRDGPWNPYMWYVAPYAFRPRHVIPVFFVLGLIGAVPVGILFNWGWLVGAAIMIPYGLLAFFSSLQQAIRHGAWWMAFVLPWLFLAYHVSYGLGELGGILQLALGRSPVQCPAASA